MSDKYWEGEVYFVRCGSWLKIGFSEDPERRVKNFNPLTPYTPVLITTLKEASFVDEAIFHDALRAAWVKGEWFKMLPLTRAALELAKKCETVREFAERASGVVPGEHWEFAGIYDGYLGERVLELRKERGISIDTLQYRAGVGCLQAIENRGGRFRLCSALRLATELRVPVMHLLTGSPLSTTVEHLVTGAA